MSEYIKREDATRVMCGECLNYVACYSADADIPVCPLFWKMQIVPAANVVERKKGVWLNYGYIKCSECGTRYSIITKVYPNYCPNCGADMRPTQNNDPNALDALKREETT